MARMRWDAARRRDLARSNPREYYKPEHVAPRKKKALPAQNPDLIVPAKAYSGIGVSYIAIGDKVIDVGLANPSAPHPDFIVGDMGEALELIDTVRASIAGSMSRA